MNYIESTTTTTTSRSNPNNVQEEEEEKEEPTTRDTEKSATSSRIEEETTKSNREDNKRTKENNGDEPIIYIDSIDVLDEISTSGNSAANTASKLVDMNQLISKLKQKQTFRRQQQQLHQHNSTLQCNCSSCLKNNNERNMKRLAMKLVTLKY